MKLSDVSFYKSIWMSSEEKYFDERKEVVFVWRSNMGKSSLMNTLFERKDLVKTSAKPWKTRLANLFLVANKYYLTDLPGYWFAKLGKNLKEELDALISWYLEERVHSIKTVVMLVDAKLWAQQTDIDMYKYILELEIPLIVVLSKSDKLGKSEVQKSINHAKNVFFWQEIIAVSSKNKLGIPELTKRIKSVLVGK